MTLGFVLCTAVVAMAGGHDKIPDGMKGFSGMVRGKVVAKVDKGFVLKIEKILKLWDGNKAKNPKSAIGKKFLVGPRWVKGDNGKWHPYELHVLFIRKLEVGQNIVIEIVHQEGHKFNMLELNGEQREWAKKGHGEEEKEREKERDRERDKEGVKKPGKDREKENDLPKKGVVAGEIIYLKDTNFKLKVRDAGRGCRVLEGETMHFFVNWIKKGGKWIPDPKEVKALGKLRLGYIVKVEFYHDGEHWRIKKIQVIRKSGEKRQKELAGKQREMEKREKKEHEKKEREEKEREKKEAHEREKEEEREEEKVKKHEEGKRPKNWPAEGGILGVVTGIGSTTITVKVLKASDNAKAMVGHKVTFYVNWVKNKDGKWVPDPEEVALIKSCDLEEKVEIHFYFEEHYRIKKLSKEK